MKVSAKNQLQGVIEEIKLGEVNCELLINIGSGQTISSVITLKALKELQLEVGEQVTALIKANDILIGTQNK